MKKIIALVLVLVMVLSLATVAFATRGIEVGGTLVSDTVNVVRYILGYAGKWRITVDSAFGSLIETVITYHDEVVHSIAHDGIDAMADSFHSVNTKYNVVNRVADAIGWCVGRVANSFAYVHMITNPVR